MADYNTHLREVFVSHSSGGLHYVESALPPPRDAGGSSNDEPAKKSSMLGEVFTNKQNTHNLSFPAT